MIKKELIEKDIPIVVEIHLVAFKNFFLSELGKNFLKLYYKSFLNDKKGFGVGVFNDDNKLIGFSVATTYSKGFNKNLIINNFLSFFIIGLKLLFTRPKSLIRLFLNISKNDKSTIDNGEYAELFSIAVDINNQGKGIGKILIEEIEKIASERGSKSITLTTDYFNNINALNFYKKMGYEVYYDFIAYPNRRMYKLIKRF